MYALGLRASWRFFTRHPWQLSLTLLSIALGTAVIIAVDLATYSATQSFQQSVKRLSSSMTHEITAVQGRIPDTFYQQLRVDWGYKNSLPQVERSVNLQGKAYTLLGTDPFAGSFDASTEVLDTDTILSLLSAPKLIAARTSGLQVGENIQIDEQIFEVVGLADLVTDDLLLADISYAQGADAGLSRIQLKLSDTQAAALQEKLPASLKLESLSQRQQAFSQMTQAFNTNLLAMSLLAMLVGAFLVYNTMTFSVLQRRASLAIARMIGVSAQQLFAYLLLEALVIGLIGAVVGIALGVLLGQGLLVLVTQTVNDLYVSVSISDILITPALVLKSLAITLFAVLLATLAPAFEAARISPVQQQRQSSLEQQQRRWSKPLAWGGLALLLVSVLIIQQSQSLVSGFFGLFLLVLAYSLCIPWVLQKLLRLATSALQASQHALFSLVNLAVRSLEASLSRVNLALIALSIAVAATVGVSLMIGSFRASVADWLEMTLSSDLYIAASDDAQTGLQGSLPERWLERVQTLAAVDSISTGRSLRLNVAGIPTPALVINPGQHSQRGFEFLQQSGDAWQGFLQGAGVLISEPLAYHQKLKAGDTLTLSAEKGLIDAPILGVFRDYSATQGMLVLPRAWYQRYWNDSSISSIGLQLKSPDDSAAVDQQLRQWAEQDAQQSPTDAVLIRSNQAIREQSLVIFDRTFAITHVLRLLVILVAFVGVFSTLMALFLEKQREFAILRATGFTPRQLQQLVLLQALILGLLAGVLALPLGFALSLLLIEVINQRSFGWSMQLHFFLSTPFNALVLSSVAALLASLYPLKRLASLSIREGLYAR